MRSDDADDILAEVCFGSRASALWYTLYCAPISRKWAPRFAVGERVAVAVEDATGDYSRWAAGVVEAADYSVEDDANWLLGAKVGRATARRTRCASTAAPSSSSTATSTGSCATRAPARHRARPPDGTRCLARMVTRRRADGWRRSTTRRRVERRGAGG